MLFKGKNLEGAGKLALMPAPAKEEKEEPEEESDDDLGMGLTD